MKKHTYEYERIIIGGSLASLLYGYCNNVPVVYTMPRIPLFFEKDKQGRSKSQIWREISFQMSLAGLLPTSSAAESIRIEEPGLLKVFPGGPTYSAFRYSDLIVFDDKNVEGWEGILEKDKRFKVLDWIDDRQSSPHDVEFLSHPESFVEEIYFYPSTRSDGNPRKKKDILAVSYLTKAQLSEMEYSDIYAKFKVLDAMKNAGIQGKKNGVDRKTGQSKRLSIKLETVHREIFDMPVEPHNEDELLEQLDNGGPKGKYVTLLKRYLHGKD
jgi:hypothetical protein